MNSTEQPTEVRSVSRGVEAAAATPAAPASGHEPLAVFIGNWINEGTTIEAPGAPPQRIVTSDVYEWGPGGRFVVHAAYGLLGEVEVGGVEIITHDAATGRFVSHFHDSFGNSSTGDLALLEDGRWRWQDEETRCTAEFSADGKVQTADHERVDGNGDWEPSMKVVLRRSL